jgi:hypothetical protein
MAIAGSHAGTRYVHCIAQIAAVELTDVTRNRKARIVTAPPLARSVTETPGLVAGVAPLMSHSPVAKPTTGIVTQVHVVLL